MNKRKIGKDKEKLAKEYLEKHGYKILQTNYQTRIGEIDIVAKDEDFTCFVEVKFRNTNNYGLGVEAVDKKKQKTIINVAKIYISFNKLSMNEKYRFDVVSIDKNEITLYKGAFQ